MAQNESFIEMCYLYASPFSVRVRGAEHPLDQLDVENEVQVLRGLKGLSATVKVATAEVLREVLVACPARLIVHVSAHCSGGPVPWVLFEDEVGAGHVITEDALAAMGPWDQEGLMLVFPACGSETLVRGLMNRCDLRCAVCCTGPVLDAAARLFFRAFYHALGEGHAVRDCFSWAQNAVRRSASPGLRSEAEKFLLLPDGSNGPAPPRGDTGASAAAIPRWPHWPYVENYVNTVFRAEAIQVASYFQSRGASRGARRALLLYGPSGLGKSAFCQEFCRFYSAPGGRLFAAGALWVNVGALAREEFQVGISIRERFARAVLRELTSRVAVEGACEPPSEESAWPLLQALAQQMDQRSRPWLLVVDGLHVWQTQEGTGKEDALLALALEELVTTSTQLCLLITTRRNPHWTMSMVKLTAHEMDPLSPQDAACLFLALANRPLYPRDFDLAAPGPGPAGGAAPLPLDRKSGGLLERLAASRLLHLLGNLPGRIIEAAVKVDQELPSLLLHPALPVPWNASGLDDQVAVDD